MNTRTLLYAGVVAGPFYLALGVTQGLVREGFDFSRHPLSVLANGSFGWVQTANFAITGLMVIAAAVGLSRTLRRRPAMTWFLGGYGLAMILAALFPADPVDGFPPGTPEGFPTSISTTGILHFACGAFAFLFLGLSGLTAAWTLGRLRRQTLAALSLVSGLAVIGGFFGGMALPLGVAGIWFAVVVGWAWLTVLSLDELRAELTSSRGRAALP